MAHTFVDRIGRPSGTGIIGYAGALLGVAASTLAGLIIAPHWGSSAIDLLYLPAVLAAAILGGLGPALFAAVLAVLAYNFFFLAPVHTFWIYSPADVLTIVVLFLVAAVTSQLAASVRRQAQLAEAHAARKASIAGLAQRLLSCTGEPEIARVLTGELARLFDCNAVVLSGDVQPRPVAAEPHASNLTPGDIAAAASVVATGKPTGRGLTRVSTVDWQLHPVLSGEKVLSVVALARDDGAPAVSADQIELLRSMLDQVALAVERARLEAEARQFAASRERDRTRTGLLSSLGQDLLPRVKAIATSVDELRRKKTADRELVSTIGSEALQIERYISNLAELGPGSDQRPIEAGDLTIDLFRRKVLRGGQQVRLTPKEYAVLAELAKHSGRVLSHAHLLRAAWGPAQEGQSEYLRVAVRGLRQKLERNPGEPTGIINEPSVGYRLAVPSD